MDIIALNAKMRSNRGNGPARRLRSEGLIPGILYGAKTDPVMLTVNNHALEQVVKKGNIGQLLLNLTVEGTDAPGKPTMIKELQRHPVTRRFLHVDFYEVRMDKKIRISIPVVTTGKAKGVDTGGMMQIIRREVDVLCLPNQIPEKITIDVANLDIGDSVHVKDIPLPTGSEIPEDVNFTVITVLGQKTDVQKTEGADQAEPAAAPKGAKGKGGK